MEHTFDLQDIQDLDISSIQHLQDDGCNYLNECYNRMQSINNIEIRKVEKILSDLTQLYISDDELFDNSFAIFCDNITKGNMNLLRNMVKYDTDEKIISQICAEISSKTAQPFIFLEILTIFNKQHIVAKLEDNHDIFKLLMNYLTTLKIELTNESYDTYIVPLYNAMIPYIKNKKTRKNFIQSLSDGIYAFKHNILTKIDYNKVQNLLMFTHVLFNTGAIEENLDIINTSYLDDAKCQLNWHTRSEETDIDYNFITESFYLFLYSIHLLYIPSLEVHDEILKTIKELERESTNILASSSQLRQQFLSKIYSDIKRLRDIDKKIVNIIDSSWSQTNFNKFYSLLASVILKTKSLIWDDILTDMLAHVNKNHNKSMEIDDNMSILIVRIIGTKLYTVNPHIRSKFLKFSVGIDPDNLEYRNNITEGVINFYNDTGLSKGEGMEMEKVSTSLIVYKFILTKCFVNLTSTPTQKFHQIVQISKKNELKFKMFMNFIVKDMSTIATILYKLVDEYAELEDDYYMQVNMGTISSLLTFCTETVQILDLFIVNSDHLKKILSCKEILMALRSSIVTVMYKYVSFRNNIEKQEKLKKIYEYTLTPIDFYDLSKYTLELISRFSGNIDSQRQLFCDGDVVDLDKVLIFSELLVAHKDIIILDKIKDMLNEIKQINDNTKNDKVVEYPEEFLDELLFVPLENPVILPRTMQIVNRDTILQYIMTDQLNPYDRKALTVESLNEFNDQPDIKNKVISIMDKFSEWKKNNQ